MIRSRAEIQRDLKTHQKRLSMGDELVPIKNLAERAGVHRDTLYAVIKGNRINEVSQIRISRMLDKLAEEPITPSRLMNISFGSDGPKLGFGLGLRDILRSK